MSEHDEREGEDDGGLRGSSAAARPPKPHAQKTKREEKRESTSRNIDDASIVRAGAYAAEQAAAADRLGLDSSTRALQASLDREKDTANRLGKAQDKILELSVKLAELQGGKKKNKKAKLKAEIEKFEIERRYASIDHAIRAVGPTAAQFAPKALLLLDRWFPTVLAAAKSGDETAQAALIRLFITLTSAEPDSDAETIREGLERLAGPKDWSLIEQGIAELAAQPPAQPPAPRTNANGAAGSH